jgi:prepilin-type N-terminal cleavage/methylation domain-containing protein
MRFSRIARRAGFTLMELMVAMAITSIIVTVLVSVTSVALETWNRSRAELRASHMGKMAVDYLARDLEAFVVRSGNNNDWCQAILDPELSTYGDSLVSSNASRLIFFTGATDRYNGNAGDPTLDQGGDVSCVAYLMRFRDPVNSKSLKGFKTYVLNRKLVDPNTAFTQLLGATDSRDSAKYLDPLFTGLYSPATISNKPNFLCENIYQFTLTFHVQTSDTTVPTGPAVLTNIPVRMGASSDAVQSFRVTGTGIVTEPPNPLVAAGRLRAVEISVTVISDFGIDQISKRKFANDSKKAEFLAKNSYQYTKVVQVPGI